MSRWLRLSTAQTERIGPFLDATDGVTEETGLGSPPTELSKDGGAFAAGPTGTHDAEGWYSVALTATHTNTRGSLVIKSHDAATHLPVWHEFQVMPADIYDALVSGTEKMPSDVLRILGSFTSATDFKDFVDNGYEPVGNKIKGVQLVDTCSVNSDLVLASEMADAVWDRAIFGHTTIGTFGHVMHGIGGIDGAVEASGSNSTTQVQTDLIASVDSHFVGGVIVFTDSMQKGQSRLITSYTGATGVVAWDDALIITPSEGHIFVILGVGHNVRVTTDGIAANALATDAVNEIADGLLDRADSIETGLTLRQAQRLIAAASAGKLSGAATTTIIIRDAIADSKDRITATVDSDGNRSAITYDVS